MCPGANAQWLCSVHTANISSSTPEAASSSGSNGGARMRRSRGMRLRLWASVWLGFDLESLRASWPIGERRRDGDTDVDAGATTAASDAYVGGGAVLSGEERPDRTDRRRSDRVVLGLGVLASSW